MCGNTGQKAQESELQEQEFSNKAMRMVLHVEWQDFDCGSAGLTRPKCIDVIWEAHKIINI
jgi:hypothetical protein